ncbi:MAG: NmrA family NAD(P)-binding protein, partial [Planctomycetota bacterium]
MEAGSVILVTGSTGQQGGAVARELLAAGHKVRAMTRKPDSESAAKLAALGAEV